MNQIQRPQSFSGSLQSTTRASVKAGSFEVYQKPFVILPLYIYPTATSWDILYKSLSTLPELRFVIVINPSSGPGSPPYPNSDYITAITRLRTYPNTELLGYVHTTSATRPATDVRNDIDIYAGWKNHPTSDIHVDGIFFDESPAVYPGKSFAYMNSVCLYAKEKLSGTLVLNPGVRVDAAYYTMADFVICSENYHNASSTDLIDNAEKSLRRKACILVHHFMGTAKEQQEFVLSLLKAELGGLFVSTNEYDDWSDFWHGFCIVVAGA